jgi:hypothetical protein
MIPPEWECLDMSNEIIMQSRGDHNEQDFIDPPIPKLDSSPVYFPRRRLYEFWLKNSQKWEVCKMAMWVPETDLSAYVVWGNGVPRVTSE